MARVLAELHPEMRGELKEPLGEIYTDSGVLLELAGEPIVAVGDVVTYHLLEAGARPKVAVVDGKTKRRRADRQVLDAIEGFDERIDVVNPPSTITADLLEALAAALARPRSTVVVVVDGEEDLATLPAVVAAPTGGSVVYGQPDEGMVLVPVDVDTRRRCRVLLERMASDYGQIESILSS